MQWIFARIGVLSSNRLKALIMKVSPLKTTYQFTGKNVHLLRWTVVRFTVFICVVFFFMVFGWHQWIIFHRLRTDYKMSRNSQSYQKKITAKNCKSYIISTQRFRIKRRDSCLKSKSFLAAPVEIEWLSCKILQDSCKILQDDASSCKIFLQDLAR